MNIKETIQKFFTENEVALDVVEKSEPKEMKFEESLLIDGETKVNLEPSTEAPELISIEAEGEFVPVPANTELELEDGRIVVTGEDAGIVIEVKSPVSEEEVVSEDEAMGTDSVESGESKAKRVIESVVKESVFNAEEEFSKLSERFNEMSETLEETFKFAEFAVKENEELKNQLNEFKKEAESKIEAFAKQDSKEPVKVSKPIFGGEKNYIFNK